MQIIKIPQKHTCSTYQPCECMRYGACESVFTFCHNRKLKAQIVQESKTQYYDGYIYLVISDNFEITHCLNDFELNCKFGIEGQFISECIPLTYSPKNKK